MDLGLTGRHVFIAGASRGIGEGLVEGFLAEGAKVALTARTPGPLAETEARMVDRFGAGRTWSMSGNMTETETLVRALDGAEAVLGPLHTVIANVGLDAAPPGFDVPDSVWESGIQQNFLGSTRLVREALRRILARPKEARVGANIIFISSIAGIDALGTVLTYGTMKAALNHEARELAKIVGREGVRINVIAPGNIIFPGGSWEERVRERPEPWTRWIRREVALQRFGTPAEIADAALFLASGRASFVTGAVIAVDGGQIK